MAWGWGFSLVKELTEAMGGAVSVESWPEQGSLFRIYLPGCAEDASFSEIEKKG